MFVNNGGNEEVEESRARSLPNDSRYLQCHVTGGQYCVPESGRQVLTRWEFVSVRVQVLVLPFLFFTSAGAFSVDTNTLLVERPHRECPKRQEALKYRVAPIFVWRKIRQDGPGKSRANENVANSKNNSVAHQI
jgi:hypothetical protein